MDEGLFFSYIYFNRAAVAGVSMLPREHRLTRMKDYEILYQEGRFFGGDFINAKVWRLAPDKYPRRDYKPTDLRIGFVVGTKISKSAVKRNRVKRQMREVVRLLLKDGRVLAGFHIAFLAKADILGKEYGEIESGILSLLRRAGVLIKPRAAGVDDGRLMS